MKQKEKTSLKQMVPDLRFPEFANAGDWEEKNLGQVLMGSPQYGLNAASVPFNDNLPAYLRITDISDEGLFLSEKKVSVDYLPKEEDYLHDGDIVLARTGASVGKAYKYRSSDGKLVYAGYLIRIQPDPKKTNSSFLFNYFFTPYYWKWVSVVSSRSGQPGINGSEYSSFPISFPSLPEQQKIADCLSSLDEVISLESQKLQSLQSYKKGLLQNLFPAEGETVPKLRFPEFVGKGDWEERELEQLARRGSGHTPNKNNPEYYNGGIPWVSLADSNKLDNGLIYETKINISQQGIENSSAVLHPSGTVIISRDAGVGKSAILHCEMAVSQHFMAWICDKSKLSNWFLYYLLQIMKPILENIAVGSTIKTIGLPYFKALRIRVPSLPEQQKIADCIISVDALIQAQSERVEGLKSHKKGLLQGLFPVMGE